jgi:hypothetical protein
VVSDSLVLGVASSLPKERTTVLEFLNNLWGLKTEYIGIWLSYWPARQATQLGRIGSFESILGLLKS